MHINFWKQRWHENQIGFHLSEVNAYLTDYWPKLGVPAEGMVLVPMCGKSLDMVWLASEGHPVIGIECSDKAINEFFTEQQLEAQIDRYKDYVIHRSNNLKIMLGDFFNLDKQSLTDIKAVYDRASLVALPEEMRKRYVEVLASNLPLHVDILLVTIEYDEALMSGPPFSVSNEEVEHLYKPSFSVKLLSEVDVLDDSSRFKQRGIDSMIERVYKISR